MSALDSGDAPAPPVRRVPPASPPAAAGASISGASRRLRALATISGSLTDALSPEDAVALVEEQALTALGATSAVVVTRGRFPPVVLPTGMVDGANEPDGDEDLTVVNAIGLSGDVLALLESPPRDARVPLAEVATTGDAFFLESEAQLREFEPWGAAMVASGAQAAAVVPVWANGELRGVLGLGWPAPQSFDEDERAFVVTLGVMCAQAIMRAHLRAAERTARDTAERANASKARFLALVSHELRTPMNAVIGYTELLATEVDGPVSASQRVHLTRVRASGRHLLELIEDLLSHARLEAGNEVVRPELASLDEVLAESIVLVGPIAHRKGLHVDIDKPGESIGLFTDVRKLRQILVNLLANALKFTDAGQITVHIAATPGDARSTIVRLRVADTGCGIAHANRERVFDAFWQENPALARAATGTGLGLAVARQFARLLGGDVTLAASAPGRGSTFELTLPAIYTAPRTTFAARASRALSVDSGAA
jgi:signal transduction histidine kinase